MGTKDTMIAIKPLAHLAQPAFLRVNAGSLLQGIEAQCRISFAYFLMRREKEKDHKAFGGCRLEPSKHALHALAASIVYKAQPVQAIRERFDEALCAVGEPAGVQHAVVEDDNIAGAGAKVQGNARRVPFHVTPRYHAEPIAVGMVL